MPDFTGKNLLRLMASYGLSIYQVAERTQLDERTVRGILNGTNKPRAKSLRRLADGLGVSVDEFFLDPTQLFYRQLDHPANPVVEELMQTAPELFAGWRETDFAELLVRVEADDTRLSTRQDFVAAISEMNRRRSLHDQLELLLDSNQSETIAGILEVLCRQV